MTVFTLEAANALLPRLQTLVGRQLERRVVIEEAFARLGKTLGDVPTTIVLEPSDSEEVRGKKRELIVLVEQYRTGWKQIESLGAVLKDPRLGLLDFYGRVDGKLVWLCWKYGEARITHYHALDEGFSSRRPIAESVRARLLN